MRYLSQFRKLESLYLHGGLLTDAGLQHLSGMPSLKYLSLIDCPNLTADGIAGLPDLPTLENLTLSSELVTSGSVARLKELPRLSGLGVNGSLNDDPELIAQIDRLWIHADMTTYTEAEFWEEVRRIW
jgi:hypothetical protein